MCVVSSRGMHIFPSSLYVQRVFLRSWPWTSVTTRQMCRKHITLVYQCEACWLVTIERPENCTWAFCSSRIRTVTSSSPVTLTSPATHSHTTPRYAWGITHCKGGAKQYTTDSKFYQQHVGCTKWKWYSENTELAEAEKRGKPPKGWHQHCLGYCP